MRASKYNGRLSAAAETVNPARSWSRWATHDGVTYAYGTADKVQLCNGVYGKSQIESKNTTILMREKNHAYNQVSNQELPDRNSSTKWDKTILAI